MGFSFLTVKAEPVWVPDSPAAGLSLSGGSEPLGWGGPFPLGWGLWDALNHYSTQNPSATERRLCSKSSLT